MYDITTFEETSRDRLWKYGTALFDLNGDVRRTKVAIQLDPTPDPGSVLMTTAIDQKQFIAVYSDGTTSGAEFLVFEGRSQFASYHNNNSPRQKKVRKYVYHASVI